MSYDDILGEKLVAFGRDWRELSGAGLPMRAALLLASIGVHGVSDLRSRAWEGPDGLQSELLMQPGCGPKTVALIADWLKS